MAGKLRPAASERTIAYDKGVAYLGDVPIWNLVRRRFAGASDAEILAQHGLTRNELDAAWAHADRCPNEMARDLRLNR